MKKILLILLIAGSVFAQNPTYTVHNYALPSITDADLIGIPRQQMVCLPNDTSLIVRWGAGTAFFYKSQDDGATWGAQKSMGYTTNRHMHLQLYGDSLYVFDGFAGPESLLIYILDPYAVDSTGGIGKTYMDTFDIVHYSPGTGDIWSGYPTGATANEWVGLIRDGTTCNGWSVSTDKGATWSVPPDSGLVACTAGRIGTFPVGDSGAAVIFDDWIGIFHYNNDTWSEETSEGGHIVPDPGSPHRGFSAVELNDTVYIGYIKEGDTAYYVASKEIGAGSATLTQMWNGTNVYIAEGNPAEYVPYIAMTTIKSIDAVGAFYTHYVAGQSTSEYRRVYFRLRYNGVWQDEQLVCDLTYCSNITAPFIVPTAHGAKAYCMVSRRYDGTDHNPSQLVVVDINIPSGGTRVKVRK